MAVFMRDCDGGIRVQLILANVGIKDFRIDRVLFMSKPRLLRFAFNSGKTLVSPELMQDYRFCSTLGIGLKSELSVDHLQKEIAIRFRKNLDLWLTGQLRVELDTFPADG